MKQETYEDGTPVDPDFDRRVMERARAFVALNNAVDREDLKMASFLELFHADMPEEQKRELIRDAGSR